MFGHDGSEEGLKEFSFLWRNTFQPKGSILVFNTGRGIKAYLELRERHRDLVQPDWVICANGSEIYRIVDGKHVLNSTWDTFISERYSKSDLETAMNKFDEVIVPSLSDKDRYRRSITLQQLD